MNEEDDDNQSWHMFTSEKMIYGYKSAESAPKARKRKNSANKENVCIESHRRSARSQLFSDPSFNIDRPFIEDSMSPSSSGINKKRINQTKNSNVNDASFRTPLSNVTNTSTSPTVELPKGKEKCKPPKVFKETTRNLFNEQDDDSNDLCDYEIDDSVIDGVSFSDDGLFDSDDSYEEYSSAQSFLVDSDTDSEDGDVNMISNNKSKNRRRSQHVVPEEYASLGSPSVKCTHCNARMWKEERVNKNVTRGTPIFSMCCKKGDVMLAPTPTPPTYLMQLYNNDVKSVSFQRNIRLYNAMFSFTSTGGNIDHSINKDGGPYIYRLNGQNHHVFGSLIPDEGQTPKFCQLYIYDTVNEVNNRLRWVNVSHGSTVDAEVVQGLIKVLDESNELVGEFRMARDRFENNDLVDLKVELKISRSESGRENHISPSDEVAAVMVGSSSNTTPDRDIIVERKKPLARDIIVEANKDVFQCVSYIHPKLMALQYPLLFPLGEDGYHDKIPKQSANLANLKDSDMISMKTYYSYRFQIRDNEALTPRLGGRLFQQLKLEQLMTDIKKKDYFGKCIGVMYVVEFQKRGFHCIRHFPKKYSARTIFDESGFPLYKRHRTNIIVQFYALAEIDDLLRSIGKSLKSFPQLPQPPTSYLNHGSNNLILEETNYNVYEMELENQKLVSNCTEEQLNVYQGILQSIMKNEGVYKEVFYALPRS
ncbi:hypothetical protein POM88_003634 [Heracleum sosnowskyi]|uniref:Uncharacterized protein n=1 Tax=Heracleum sosnowskyi TaxID=360622 RepID=A0AAD8NBV5_9APIA|nr:hypothetical protein POM88_003634 [Heracleum sosnowskyi]